MDTLVTVWSRCGHLCFWPEPKGLRSLAQKLQARVRIHWLVSRSVILVDGNFRATGLTDSIVIATGEVRFNICRGSIVIASVIAGNSIAKSEEPSLLIAPDEVDRARYRDVVINAGLPVTFAWGTDNATLLNTEHRTFASRTPQITHIEQENFFVPAFSPSLIR